MTDTQHALIEELVEVLKTGEPYIRRYGLDCTVESMKEILAKAEAYLKTMPIRLTPKNARD